MAHASDSPAGDTGQKVQLAALVLAAGYSSRMGEFKPLLTIGERTAVECCVRLFREAGVDEVAVAAGYRAEEVMPVAERAGACCVVNREFERGMFSSVAAGVRWLRPQIEACFILPVDMPLVLPSTVQRMMDEYGRSKARILYPVFNGRRGHPPLVAKAILNETLGEESANGLRGLLRRHEHEAREVAVEDEGTVLDMDDPEDLMRMRALSQLRKSERS